MAQPDLEYFTRRGLLLKLEVTEGTDPTPTPAADAFELLDGSSGTEFDRKDRARDRPFLTNQPFAVANKRSFVQGGFEVAPPVDPGNAGDADAAVHAALLMCGMAQTLDAAEGTTEYNPISADIASAHAYWYHAGILRKHAASRGNVSELKAEIGEVVMGQMRLDGMYDETEQTAVPSGWDYSAFTTPTIATHANSTLIANVIDAAGDPVVEDLSLWGKMLSVNFGNEVGIKEYTTMKRTGLTNRAGTFTARFARPDKSDFDVWAVRDAAQIVTFLWTLTEDDGRTTYLLVRGQIEAINEVDIDGDYGLEVTGPAIASDSGGDEFILGFGGGTQTP